MEKIIKKLIKNTRWSNVFLMWLVCSVIFTYELANGKFSHESIFLPSVFTVYIFLDSILNYDRLGSLESFFVDGEIFQIYVNRSYRHYKGGVYEVVGVAYEESTMNLVVIYESHDEGKFTRPLSDWYTKIDDNTTRFTLV